MTVLNVGLATPNGSHITAERALATLRVVGGWRPVRHAVHQSDTEPTLIAEGPPINAASVFAVAKALQQDAIAVWDGRNGQLYGPNSWRWGDFNPEFFLTLDGHRLVEPATAKAA